MPTARRRKKGNKKKRDISQINNATNENNDHHVDEDFNDGKRNGTISSNISPSTSMRKCKACLKFYSNLQMHFVKQPICAQMINDSSIIGKVVKKHDNFTKVPNTNVKVMNLNTYEATQLHDQSAGFLEINANNEEDDAEYDDEDDSSSLSKDGNLNIVQTNESNTITVNNCHNTYQSTKEMFETIDIHNNELQNNVQFRNLFESILDNTSSTIQPTRTNHKNKSTIIFEDSSNDDNSFYHNSNSDDDSNINENEEVVINVPVPSSNPSFNEQLVIVPQPQSNIIEDYDYDFRDIQKFLLKQSIHLHVDTPTMSSIQLLRIMQIGNIPNCHYKSIIKWFNWTLMKLLPETNASFSLPLSRLPEIQLNSKSVINHLDNLFCNNNPEYSLSPLQEIIQLPSRKYAKISYFRFSSIVISLLSDPDFLGNPLNNHFQNKYYRNPTLQTSIRNEKRQYSDLHHGSAFHNAYNKCCKNKRDVLLPIIAFIDGTPIDTYGRLKLEVVMISLGIATQTYRNKTDAWRILGYIPDEFNETEMNDNKKHSTKQSSTQRNEATSRRKDYHHMLSFIFKDIITLEKSGKGILWKIYHELPSGKIDIETVCLKPFLILIVGDAVGNDKLCDRYISYGKSVNRLCRDCDCPTEHLNNHEFYCSFTNRKALCAMTDSELKKISYYKVENNAFDKHHFGDDEHGINGSTPPEPLHQNNIGCQKKLNIFFGDCLTKKGKIFYNEIVSYICRNWSRQSSRNYFDIYLFKDGYERPQLTGGEVITQSFVLYLTLIQTHTLMELPKVEANVSRRYKTKKNKVTISNNDNDDLVTNDDDVFDEDDVNDELSSSKTVKQVNITKMFYPKVSSSISFMKKWIMLFEMSLCLDAWLTQSSIPYCDVFERNGPNNTKLISDADMAMRQYLKLYCEVLKEPIGNGTQTAKIHWLLHIPHYIRKFGPPNVISTQRPESNLSPMVKNAGRATQLRPSVLSEQATKRYHESVLIGRSYKILHSSKSDLMMDTTVHESVSAFSTQRNHVRNAVFMDNNRMMYLITGRYQFELKENYDFNKVVWPKKTEKSISHNKKLIQQVINLFRRDDYQLKSKYINCFTCLNIVDKDNDGLRNRFRADPYFFKKIWMDWCITRWTTTDSDELSDRDDEDDESNQEVTKDEMNLCRILMFIDTSTMEFDATDDIPKLLAVVRCTSSDKRNQTKKLTKECRLITSYEMEDVIRIIPCNTISKTAYVVSDLTDIKKKQGTISYASKYVLLVKEKCEWPNMFIDNKWL